MENFETALKNWLEAVKRDILDPQVNNEWVRNHGHEYQHLEMEEGSKFIRIVSVVSGPSRSAWAFVAKDDGSSKALGNWKMGDIFKSASWRQPAKGKRGNIFDLSKGKTCGIQQWTGPNYR